MKRCCLIIAVICISAAALAGPGDQYGRRDMADPVAFPPWKAMEGEITLGYPEMMPLAERLCPSGSRQAGSSLSALQAELLKGIRRGIAAQMVLPPWGFCRFAVQILWSAMEEISLKSGVRDRHTQAGLRSDCYRSQMQISFSRTSSGTESGQVLVITPFTES